MKRYGKIEFCSNPDTNFVYHMLSVARCGYDNDYGRRYRSRYDAADLGCLKRFEDELTVCGGEHCGALYHLCVALPARAESRVTNTMNLFWLQRMRRFRPE